LVNTKQPRLGDTWYTMSILDQTVGAEF